MASKLPPCNRRLTGLILELLDETVIPLIATTIDGINYDPVFQQDGAPPHLYLSITRFFTIWRWIGRRGVTSPDLTSHDFFLLT